MLGIPTMHTLMIAQAIVTPKAMITHRVTNNNHTLTTIKLTINNHTSKMTYTITIIHLSIKIHHIRRHIYHMALVIKTHFVQLVIINFVPHSSIVN